MRTFCKIFFLVSVCVLFLNSCKERGCTNPAAVNYDVTADEDDGSCIVCSTTEELYDYQEVYLEDETWGSPHYNEMVAKFELSQNIENPTNQVCGTASTYISVKVRSLINQKMYLTYWVRDYTGPININIYGQVMLEPYAVADEGKYALTDQEPFLPIGLDSIQAVQQGSILYY